MKVGYKIWLENNGKAFGKGPRDLLRGVEETSSLNQAAARMGMSYSKAWRIIRNAERKLGVSLLERTIGGLAGGGSRITADGKVLLGRCDQFEQDVHDAIERLYRRYFDDLQLTGSGRRGKKS